MPDETVTAKSACCAFCQVALSDADHVLHGRPDKIDLPAIRLDREMTAIMGLAPTNKQTWQAAAKTIRKGAK